MNDDINKRIDYMMKRFATPENKITTTPDIIARTKELKAWVENNFKKIEIKEVKTPPFLTFKELQQKIIDDNKKLFSKVLMKK
jgi:hypothetical protein